MINNNISLPYPVLGIEGDFKYGEFSVTPKIYTSDDNLYIIEDVLEISNEYLYDLYLKENLNTVYKIVCSSTLYCETIFEEKNIIIPLEKLANHIEIEVFLVAKNDILSYSDLSFNDDYRLGKNKGVFNIKKGNIIGFAGSIKIDLKSTFTKGASSIFKFKRGQDQTLSFDVNEDQIVITYPYDINQNTDIVKYLPEKHKMLFLNLFIIPALDKAFSELIKNNENGDIKDFTENHEWAMILCETYSDWFDDDTYKSAQLYLKKIMNSNGKIYKMPILEVLDELIKK
jgi:hypothetical protein